MEVRNRFNGLDLIDRVPEELLMEVHDIIQEAMNKTIPRKKEMQKGNKQRNKQTKKQRLSEEALQITVQIKEVKGKGKKERYTYLNTEIERIARRDKKAFLSDQCKEI